MKNDNKIVITKERRKDMTDAIKLYFSEEQGEEIGDLRATLVLDFIIERLAPDFYNQGVSDSYQYLKGMIEDVLSIQKY
jgi:uncharacterized protein (DUF2164 family)